MSCSRTLARILAENGGGAKIFAGKTIGNISPDIEWIKWLSYESKLEKARMKYFDTKKISELSYEEVEEAYTYSKNKLFARLFKIYGTSECTKEEYMKVYDFMCNESIEKLMLSKLTVEELKYAKQEIIRLSKISQEQLKAKIEEEQKPENYERLSMVDSYIFHIISNIDYDRNLSNLSRKIEAQLASNETMRQRSLYLASNEI